MNTTEKIDYLHEMVYTMLRSIMNYIEDYYLQIQEKIEILQMTIWIIGIVTIIQALAFIYCYFSLKLEIKKNRQLMLELEIKKQNEENKHV